MLWQVTLVDTAGLRQSSDEIEVQGMQRARSAVASADIVTVVLDPAAQPVLAAQVARIGRMPDGTSPPAAGSHADLRDGMRGSGAVQVQADSKDILEELLSLADDGALHQGGLPGESVPGSLITQQQRLLVVHNKSDLAPCGLNRDASSTKAGPAVCSISCRTGQGLDELLDRLSSLVEATAALGETQEGATLITRCTSLF